MGDFAGMMQSAVLDRPVLDQTGTRREDTTSPSTGRPTIRNSAAWEPRFLRQQTATNPPPNLYTAIQEQIGLKLDATKAPADVIVIDHVEKPSEN